MIYRVTGLLLLVVIFFGYFSEIDLADDVEEPAQISAEATIESAHHDQVTDQAPYDDCGEGAPCSGHCHFGQCLSVMLVSVPQLTAAKVEVHFQSFYRLPVVSGGESRLFRPPIS